MGVILRQSSQTFFYKILGTAIGFFSMLFVYPLNHEAYGFAQFLISCSLILLPLASLGLPTVIVKIHEDFNRHFDLRHLLSTFLLPGAFIMAVFLVLITLGHQIAMYYGWYLDNTPLFNDNIGLIVVITCLTVIQLTIIGHLSNFGLIAIPSAIQDIGLKLILPLIVLLSVYSTLLVQGIGWYLVSYYLISIVLLISYGLYHRAIKWNIDTTYFTQISKSKELLAYGAFVSLTSLGAMIAFKLDSVMITTMLDATKNGLYFNIFVMASVIDLPNQAISKSSGPAIARHWINNEVSEINSIYNKSSVVNQIVGTFIYLGLLINLNTIFTISSNPEAFEGGLILFILLGLAKLIDGYAGVNNQILFYSSGYKANFFFVVSLALLNIFTNVLLIPKYGVLGAAIATCISIVLYNIGKLLYIYFIFRIQPFNSKQLLFLLYTGFLFILLQSIGFGVSIYFESIIKTLLLIILYLPIVYYLKLSEDLNNVAFKLVKKLF